MGISSSQSKYLALQSSSLQQHVDNDECVKCILSKFPVKTFRDVIFKRKYNEECQIVCLSGRILPMPSQKTYFTPILEKYAVYANSSIYLQNSVPSKSRQIYPEEDLSSEGAWSLKGEETHEADFYLVDPTYPSLKVCVKGSKKCKVKPQEFYYNIPKREEEELSAFFSSNSTLKAAFGGKRSTSANTTKTFGTTGTTPLSARSLIDIPTLDSESIQVPESEETLTERLYPVDEKTNRSSAKSNSNNSVAPAPMEKYVIPGGGKSLEASLEIHTNPNMNYRKANRPLSSQLTNAQEIFLTQHKVPSQTIQHKPMKLIESSVEWGQQVIVLGVLSRVVEGKRAYYVLEPIQTTSITERYMNRKKWKSFHREVFLQYFTKHQTMIVADGLYLNRKKPFPMSSDYVSKSRPSSSRLDEALRNLPEHVGQTHQHASQHIELEDLEDDHDIHAIGYRHRDEDHGKFDAHPEFLF